MHDIDDLAPRRLNVAAGAKITDIPLVHLEPIFWSTTTLRHTINLRLTAMKSLVDLCLFSVSSNLDKINNVGNFLSWSDKEVLLERLCDHDLITDDHISLISNNLFSPQLRTVSLKYNENQITDALLGNLALCGCQLSNLTLKYCHKITDKGMINLIKTQMELTYLNVRGGPSNQLTDKWLLYLKCEGLSTLILQGLDITEAAIQSVMENCPNLHEVRFVRCPKLTDSAVEIVTNGLQEKLEILDLTDARQLTDSSCVAIGNGKCSNLKELYLTDCIHITGKTLRMIQLGCPKLLSLDVGFCYKTLKYGTNFVSMDVFPKTLIELTLHGVQLRDDQIKELVSRLPLVKVLRLCGIIAVDNNVLEVVCSGLGKTLRQLDLSACRSINDEGLTSVSRHCQVIEELILSCCTEITGKPLEPLLHDAKRAMEIRGITLSGCKKFSIELLRLIVTSCHNLELLKLAGIKEVDDELLMSMAANCSKLRAINLKGCDKVTDNGVCEIASFCPLSEIVVAGVHGLTDKSIFALANSCTATLEDVYASACTKITTQAIRYLKDCCLKRIFVDHKTPNLDPNQLMAKNLDTGEFCRADLELAHATTFLR